MIKQELFFLVIYHKRFCYYNVLSQKVQWLILETNGCWVADEAVVFAVWSRRSVVRILPCSIFYKYFSLFQIWRMLFSLKYWLMCKKQLLNLHTILILVLFVAHKKSKNNFFCPKKLWMITFSYKKYVNHCFLYTLVINNNFFGKKLYKSLSFVYKKVTKHWFFFVQKSYR